MSGQILVVDGAATNRITLKVRLAAACYDPLTARDGAEALAILSRMRPTMVLIGGSPGDMSAIELCRRIVGTDPAIPVMMTVPRHLRVAALTAGAAAVLDSGVDEMNLLARIRGLMRDHASADPEPMLAGMAEAQASFDLGSAQPAPPASILLVAEDAAVGLGWRQALGPRLGAQLRISDPDRALSEAAVGLVPDLYLIAADIAQQGDGLRLLSELRSRRSSRNAGFAVVLNAARQDMMSVALDLGAGDVLPATLAAADEADEAALRVAALIRRKRSADIHRATAEHERSLARIDPLTGLANRRFALPRLAELCDPLLNPSRDCAVIAIDIDRFKQVNDSYGHAAGDAVLIELASRLEQAVAGRGFVARIGGEEFLAVLPDMSQSEAAALAVRLRAAVVERPFVLTCRDGWPPLPITISAGVAGLMPDPGASAQSLAVALLERADAALLNAKRSGRNRLIVAGLDAAA